MKEPGGSANTNKYALDAANKDREKNEGKCKTAETVVEK